MGASKATITKAADMNLELWVGLIMLIMGLLFLIWVLLKPPAPITAAEAEAARKAREDVRPEPTTRYREANVRWHRGRRCHG